MTQTNNLRVAAIQCDIRWEDAQYNINAAIQAINSTDCDIAILPEMFATGFSMNHKKISQAEDGLIVREMKAAAKTSGKAIVFSAAIEQDGKCYNRLYFLTPEGETYKYDKRHLFRMGGEHNSYTPGTERIIINYKGVRILPLICYDLRFPVFSRGADQYDLVIYIASWPTPRLYAWNTLLRARAIENQAYCIGVNRIGDDPANHYSGGTVILDFMGKPIIEATENTAEAITADIDLTALNEFKSHFAAFLDAD